MSFTIKGNLSVLVLALAPMLSAAPQLRLDKTTIGTVNLTSGINGGEFVQATNVGDGSLTLTATTSDSWLSVNIGLKGSCAANNGNCYLIGIGLTMTDLPPAIYTGTVTLTDVNAIDSPQDITITVNTAGVPSSPINAYVSVAGLYTSTDIFPVFTTGVGSQAAVSTQSGGNWLRYLDGALAPHLIQVAAQVGQAPGLYLGQVALFGSSVASDNKTIVVRLNITNDPIIERESIVPVRLTSFQNGPVQNSEVKLNNAGAGTLTITAATSTSTFLTASVSGSSSIIVSASPNGLAPGLYSGRVTLTSNAANNALISIPVQLLVAIPGVPLITSSGIVNGGNGASGPLSPGDIGAIYGNQLAPAGSSSTSDTTPLPTLLGGAQVLVNNVPVPLYYVSPGQINFQVPYSLLSGQATTVRVVSNGQPGNIRPLSIVTTAPTLLAFVSFLKGNYGVIVNSADGSLTMPTGTVVPGFRTHPAKPGDVVTVYAIGFGQTSPGATEGQAAAASAFSTVSPVAATFGGGFGGSAIVVTPLFTGLTPTLVGLYQSNVRIPDGVILGAATPLSITVNGVQSTPVMLAISATGN